MSNDYRESGVPGLSVWGSQRWGFEVHAEVGDGRRESVYPQRVGAIRPNHFPRVRDAKAAAKRLAEQVDMPWNDGHALVTAFRAATHEDGCRRKLEQAVVIALTGRTLADLAEEESRRHEAERRRFMGEDVRDRLADEAEAAGHDVYLAHYGVKSYKGNCSGCGELFKVAAGPYGGHGRTCPTVPGGYRVAPCPARVTWEGASPVGGVSRVGRASDLTIWATGETFRLYESNGTQVGPEFPDFAALRAFIRDPARDWDGTWHSRELDEAATRAGLGDPGHGPLPTPIGKGA